MKNIICLCALLASLGSQATTSEMITTCDDNTFLVRRQASHSGYFKYEAVFRGNLVRSMIEQKAISVEHINEDGEIVRDVQPFSKGHGVTGFLGNITGFTFDNTFEDAGRYSLVFSSRYGRQGSYVFNKCSFKY